MYPNKQKQPYLNVFYSICVKNLAFCLQFGKAILCSDATARYGFTAVERPEGFLVLAIASLGKHVTEFNQTPEAEGSFLVPTLVSQQESLKSKINQTKATVKSQLKKVLCTGVAVGNCSMEEKQIFQNVQMSVNFLVSLLKKNWQNVSVLPPLLN
ncbi:hypothetical protein Vadar_006507 [Vaccinium darrowii]|uniref:Uncharacterized protein n=1 Tax=Vaccinium darrowii TaxID=229202 RepID=A0ACB7X8F1_9ERIC|nr:hypothetical protein Vadar_006507 [Vaccinium darrowii]